MTLETKWSIITQVVKCPATSRQPPELLQFFVDVEDPGHPHTFVFIIGLEPGWLDRDRGSRQDNYSNQWR